MHATCACAETLRRVVVDIPSTQQGQQLRSNLILSVCKQKTYLIRLDYIPCGIMSILYGDWDNDETVLVLREKSSAGNIIPPSGRLLPVAKQISPTLQHSFLGLHSSLADLVQPKYFY